MKTDFKLGKSVSNNLKKLGIESPIIDNDDKNIDDIRLSLLKNNIKTHNDLHLDLNCDSISDTPQRIANLMVDESMKGLFYKNFPSITTFKNTGYNNAVSVTDMLIFSICEHHWERIIMRVSISYIPKNDVMGLSKFSRLADFFASRPIVQERYTQQLFETLKFILKTKDVAVHVRGIHLCMFARGVQEPCSSTTTMCHDGKFNESSIRNDFLQSINLSAPIIPN